MSKDRILAAALLLTLAASLQTSAAEEVFTYQNPIKSPSIPGLRDPQILRVDDVYYMTGTCPPFFFGPNPGVKLWSSWDLKEWKFEKVIVPRKEGSWYLDRFWAPEIHVKTTRKGPRFYCTFNCRSEQTDKKQAIGLAVASTIHGPYTVLTPDRPLTYGNDAHIFTDEDGKDYLFRSGVAAMQVDLEKGRIIGEAWKCIGQEGKPEGWDVGQGIGHEGPFVVKRDGTYFLFYSSWGRGYEVGYATASNLRGPWKKYEGNPIYGAQEKEACVRYGKEYTQPPEIPWVNVGHGSPFVGPDGEWWISSHFIASGPSEKNDPKTHNGPLPGYDPLVFNGGRFKKSVPTWTPQRIPVKASKP